MGYEVPGVRHYFDLDGEGNAGHVCTNAVDIVIRLCCLSNQSYTVPHFETVEAVL